MEGELRSHMGDGGKKGLGGDCWSGWEGGSDIDLNWACYRCHRNLIGQSHFVLQLIHNKGLANVNTVSACFPIHPQIHTIGWLQCANFVGKQNVWFVICSQGALINKEKGLPWL